MDLMSKSEESRLTGAVERMIDMVSDGASPTSALLKVAGDLNDRAVTRVAELYNQSRTMFQLAGSGQRDGSFELADPEVVVSERRKQAAAAAGLKLSVAVSTPDLTRPDSPVVPSLAGAEKVALSLEPMFDDDLLDRDPEPLFALREKLSAAVAEASEQLRCVFNTDGFHSLEAVVLEKRGEDARPVLDLLWKATDAAKFRQKRATPVDVSSVTLTDLLASTMQQVASVERMVDMSLRYHKRASMRAKQAAKQAAKAHDGSPVKQAADGTSAVSGLWSTFSNAGKQVDQYVAKHPSVVAKPKPHPTDTNMLEAGKQLEDPTLDRSIQEIRVRAGLNDLLANDEVISGYSDDEVIDAFNHVSTVAPTAMENRAVLRDLLRRALTGGVSSFDIGQAVGLSADIDKARAGNNTLIRGELPSDVAAHRPTAREQVVAPSQKTERK